MLRLVPLYDDIAVRTHGHYAPKNHDRLSILFLWVLIFMGANMNIGEIDLTASQYDFVGLDDGFFDDKTNDEICLYHLLYVSDRLEYGYILDDLYGRLVSLYSQYFDETQADIMLDNIIATSVNRCEYFFRLFIAKGVYANQCPSLADNGYLWAITSFGYLLPYYVTFDETTKRLSIDIEELKNDRPPTLDNSPHAKAVHYAHQHLGALEHILNGSFSVKLYQLGNHAYSEERKDTFKQLEQYYLEILPQLRRDRVTMSTKQTARLLKKHDYSYNELGYEHTTLVKKIGILNKKHFKQKKD